MDWFSADYHFFHDKIIKYCNRPFQNEKEMRETIIRKNNRVVSKDDNLYMLGDLAMIRKEKLFKLKPVLDKMNGNKHLILGNHDDSKPFNYEKLGILTVHTAITYTNDIILRHDPATANIAPEKIWLVGHVHKLFKVLVDPIICYNVGVDVNDFYPVTLSQIMTNINNKKILSQVR